MPSRVRPVIEARLYTEGDGDPVLTDHGFGWWDNLEQTARWGSISLSGGRPTLEYIPNIGLVCRPYLTFQDLRLTHVSTSGGTWSEVRPVGIGSGLKYRLVQSDTTAGVVWTAKSLQTVPADAAFAFTVVQWDTPSDHNISTYPPRLRLVFGIQGNTPDHCIELNKAEGNAILKWVAGAWDFVAGLPSLDTSGDNGEAHVWVRVHRGRLAVSLDRGNSYTVFKSPDGSAITLRAGAWGIEGQGGGCVVGMHQLTYAAGVFTSRAKNTLNARALAPTVTLAARKNEPGACTVSLADIGVYGSAIAQYTATLTPATITATPFNWHYSPELYTVTYTIDPIETTVTQAYTTLSDAHIIACQISKPEDLAESSATLTLRRDAASAWSGTYRNRKVLLRLGWYYDDASYVWTTAFTGYIVAQSVGPTAMGEIGITLTLANVGHRLRRVQWQPDFEVPLGGQTVNQAMDDVLVSEGIPRNSSYRVWHANGDVVTVPAGLPEDPAELTRRGEAKWSTLERLASYAGLKLGVTDAGALVTVTPAYVTGTIHDLQFTAATSDPDQIGLGLEHTTDYRETLTAVFLTGTSEYGEDLVVAAIDTYAETNTGSGRFTPWREPLTESAPGTVTPGILTVKAQALATEHFGLKREPRTVSLVDPTIGRRDEIRIYGATAVDIPDGTRHMVLSLDHSIGIDPRSGAMEHRTTAGIRRA